MTKDPATPVPVTPSSSDPRPGETPWPLPRRVGPRGPETDYELTRRVKAEIASVARKAKKAGEEMRRFRNEASILAAKRQIALYDERAGLLNAQLSDLAPKDPRLSRSGR